MMNKLFLQLNQRAAARSKTIALAAPGYPDLCYGDLLENIRAVVDGLCRLGIKNGDAVAFIADREPATAILALGLLSHAVAVPLNPDSRPHELTTLFMRLPIKAILVPAGYRLANQDSDSEPDIALIEYDARAWHIELLAGDLLDSTTGIAKSHALPGDSSLILQTSGSTSTPRIVPLSHDNLLASADNIIRSLELSEHDWCLHMLPLFHIGGLVDVLLAPLLSGGKVVFNRGFDPDNFFKITAEYAPNWTQTVPAMLQELVEIADRQGNTQIQKRFRFIRSVSSPLTESLYHAAHRVFSTAIVEIYGMTETAGVITSNPLDAAAQKPGSVGISAGPSVRIVNVDGKSASPLQPGEVQVKGDSVMNGYITGPSVENTGQEFDDGWLKTGDLGYLDEEGYLFLTGRSKDIINRGGEKISPAEIDAVVLEYSAVRDAASFAIPDLVLGEDIALVVVVEPGAGLVEEELRDYLKQRLAYYKQPRRIVQVDAIPRHNGKLKRHQLNALLPEIAAVPDGEVSLDESGPAATGNVIARLWAEVLEVEGVGHEDDFFFMGGNSLLATILVNRLQERLGIPVMVSALYDAPVLHEFEQYLQEHYSEEMENIHNTESRD